MHQLNYLIMPNGILALIASLPIVAIFVFMVGFRWPATKAMPLAFVIALILAFTVLVIRYGHLTYPYDEPPEKGG